MLRMMISYKKIAFIFLMMEITEAKLKEVNSMKWD